MYRRIAVVSIIVVAGWLAAGAQQGSSVPDTPEPQASPPPAASSQTQSTPDDGASQDEKKPKGLKKILKRAAPNCVHVGGASDRCWSDSEQEKEAQKKQQEQNAQDQPKPSSVPQNEPAPRSSNSDEEASSKSNAVDLSPPTGDGTATEAPADVQELHPYNPHNADKNVEVGDFYFKRGNFRAAESRYAEALLWMPNHALAKYRLAEAQEKLGKMAEASANYQAYLALLPNGELAEEAKNALARINPKLQSKDSVTYPPASKPR
jgi:tetratricopeptide (TPR) repeat protein